MNEESTANSNRPEAEHNGSSTEKSQPLNAPAREPATQAQFQKVEQEMGSYERATLRWARTAVIASLATGIFIALQWREMRNGGSDTHALAEAAKVQSEQAEAQTEKMKDLISNIGAVADSAKRSADIAKATLDDSKRSFLIQNRPYLSVEVARLLYKPEGGRRLEATCLVRNSGKTPAIGVRPDISIEGRVEPLPGVITRLGSKSTLDIGADQSVVIPVPGAGPIRPDSATRIESVEVKIFVYGFLDYSDLFGCSYTTEFCGYYDPTVDSDNPLMLLACRDHNKRTENKCTPK